MSPPLRLRLLNTAALLAFSVFVVAVAYVMRASMLERTLDGDLESVASHVQRVHVQRDDELRPVLAVVLDRNAFAQPVLFVQATDSAGGVLARSETLDGSGLPLDAARLTRALRGEAWIENVDVEGHAMRMYVAPLWVAVRSETLRTAGVVQVARVVDPSAGREVAALIAGMLVAALVTAPLALASGAIMTRTALAPLERFVSTLRAIRDADDLGQRVVLEPRPAYPLIVSLASEFNNMLGRLEAAARRVDNVLAAQRRFIADASHELRTPLTSLRGNVDLLREDWGSGASDEHMAILADMQAESERMGRLVKDLLLLADADSGRRLVLEPVDLGLIVHHAVRAARPLRADVEIHLRRTTPGAVWVCGDRDRLAQVVLILLDNALKFSPPNGVVDVRLDVTHQADQAGSTLRVTDTGPGVAPDERELIFERFYRSDHARGGDGAGLGLAIARWIVDEHAGSLSVESARAGGSTFLLWLPAPPPT